MSEKYCQAGKCECGRYSADDQVAYCEQGYSREMDFEVCPYPSRQVPVKQEGRYCPDTKRNCQYLTPSANELNKMIDEAKAAGRLAGIGECVDEIKKMLAQLNLDDESDFWRSVVLNETIAALEKLRDK